MAASGTRPGIKNSERSASRRGVFFLPDPLIKAHIFQQLIKHYASIKSLPVIS
jgi:hypothetical protein